MYAFQHVDKDIKFSCHTNILTLRCPAAFGDSHAKTTGSHVALHTFNSSAESGSELFKGSKEAASLLVYTQKKFFAWGLRIFYE